MNRKKYYQKFINMLSIEDREKWEKLEKESRILFIKRILIILLYGFLVFGICFYLKLDLKFSFLLGLCTMLFFE